MEPFDFFPLFYFFFNIYEIGKSDQENIPTNLEGEVELQVKL